MHHVGNMLTEGCVYRRMLF